MDASATGDLIKPLTRHRKRGGVLTREPEVERQIRSALALSPEQLLVRLRKDDREDPEYLRDETLVYLIREYFQTGANELVTPLSQKLLDRCAGQINRRLHGLRDDQDRWENARTDVVNELVTRLLDLDSDRADFFQVRFGRALRMLTIRVFHRYRLEKDLLNRSVRLSYLGEDEDAGEERSKQEEPQDPGLPPDLKAVASDGLAAILDPRCREAFILRYYAGWPTSSKDPAVPTISEKLGVSDRTVRNWLRRAEADLRRWREQEGD